MTEITASIIRGVIVDALTVFQQHHKQFEQER